MRNLWLIPLKLIAILLMGVFTIASTWGLFFLVGL
jgi:hypothetical protein